MTAHARRLARGLADAWAETWHSLTHPTRDLALPMLIALCVISEFVILAILTHGYKLSAELCILVTEPMYLDHQQGLNRGGHATHGEWWWRGATPADASPDYWRARAI